MKNKDTDKAIEAKNTLIKYCDRYEHCRGCFFQVIDAVNGLKRCAINYPYMYTKKWDELKAK